MRTTSGVTRAPRTWRDHSCQQNKSDVEATLLGALRVFVCEAAPETKALVRNTARGRRSRLLIAATSVVVLTVFGAALARDYHSNPWLLTWIASSCCVTNDCCWEVSESELRSLPNDNWEVISTGQVLQAYRLVGGW